jgi:MazG family protein
VSGGAGKRFEELVATMHTLRAPGGCPWDAEQTHASLKPYVIEEAHEVCDAIDSGDDRALADELGDVLLQVVFHAEMAAERQAFAVEDVIDRLTAKLVRRHPHVFAGADAATSAEVLANWSRIKREERGAVANAATESALSGVPRTMPALLRAHRLGERAAAVGFDWKDAAGVREKVREELDEMIAAESEADPARVAEEIGDALFTLASYARHRGANAEMLLHAALDRFQARFARMEAELASQGLAIETLDERRLDEAWQSAKRR